MSKIEWCDESWNPVVGCELASPGCTNCYAMQRSAPRQARLGTEAYQGLTKEVKGQFVWTGLVRLQDNVIGAPMKRKKPTVYFVCSMSDLFQPRVHDQWRDRVFDVMEDCPQHVFLLLTKRPDRMRIYFLRRYKNGAAPDHIWAGTSVEDQVRADLRLPDLIETPAKNLFVSAEPLLGPVDLSKWLGMHGVMWVVGGGESGMTARQCHPDWARGLRDQCAAANVPFMWKQWGRWKPELVDGKVRGNDQRPMGGGRLLDGRFHNDRPTAIFAEQEAAE